MRILACTFRSDVYLPPGRALASYVKAIGGMELDWHADGLLMTCGGKSVWQPSSNVLQLELSEDPRVPTMEFTPKKAKPSEKQA